jgi:hypothetical protein
MTQAGQLLRDLQFRGPFLEVFFEGTAVRLRLLKKRYLQLGPIRLRSIFSLAQGALPV